MQANGIDDVLRILDGLIADNRAKGDPLGHFPALYRDDAWMHAVLLSLQPPAAWPLTVKALDDKVEFLGKLLAQPGGLVGKAVDIIRDTESKDVPAIIDALNSIVQT
jgi:hypothetical protein